MRVLIIFRLPGKLHRTLNKFYRTLKKNFIKEELKINKHLLNENIAVTSTFYSHTSNPRGRLPIHFPDGHS